MSYTNTQRYAEESHKSAGWQRPSHIGFLRWAAILNDASDLAPKIRSAYIEGAMSFHDDINPFSKKSELHKYCAWLAGKTDHARRRPLYEQD